MAQDDQTGGGRSGRRGNRSVVLVLAMAALGAIALAPILAEMFWGVSSGAGARDDALLSGSCPGSAAALQSERPALDEDFAVLLEAWSGIDGRRSGWVQAPAPGGSADRRTREAFAAYIGLEDDWRLTEAKLEEHIAAVADAPASAEWPLDPGEHTTTLERLFQLRAGLNEDWADLASALQHTAARIAGLSSDAGAAEMFRDRADVYGDYAQTARLWAAHWRIEAAWRGRTAAIALVCWPPSED